MNFVLSQEVSQMALELKSRAAAYNSVKTSLQSFEYKQQYVTILFYLYKKTGHCFMTFEMLK